MGVCPLPPRWSRAEEPRWAALLQQSPVPPALPGKLHGPPEEHQEHLNFSKLSPNHSLLRNPLTRWERLDVLLPAGLPGKKPHGDFRRQFCSARGKDAGRERGEPPERGFSPLPTVSAGATRAPAGRARWQLPTEPRGQLAPRSGGQSPPHLLPNPPTAAEPSHHVPPFHKATKSFCAYGQAGGLPDLNHPLLILSPPHPLSVPETKSPRERVTVPTVSRWWFPAQVPGHAGGSQPRRRGDPRGPPSARAPAGCTVRGAAREPLGKDPAICGHAVDSYFFWISII